MAAYLVFRSHGERQKIRQNPLDKSEAELMYEYRLSRAAILELYDILLKEDLQPSIGSPRALTLVEKVLISLKMLASGSFQSSTKNNLNVAQSTVSEVLSRFVHCLLRKNKRFCIAYMPYHSSAQLTKGQFYSLDCFPGVIGSIDGTHIYLLLPHLKTNIFLSIEKIFIL